MKLHNAISKKELKSKLELNPIERRTVSFYKYYHLANPQVFRDHLYLLLEPAGVLGRIYVAREGINAQVSVPLQNWEMFIAKMNEITFLEGNRLNLAVEDNPKSFVVLKVKLRNKIVADGLNDQDFNPSDAGIHLKAREFNELSSKPNTVVVDMRNHYESEVGHFEGAILPDVDTFRDSLPVVENILRPYEDKHIIMYCTGGIRCEKASAWFKHKGFKNIYQLEGGIIKYTNDAREQGLENKFHGKNFVFDERLGERITNEIISHCHQCGNLADTHTNCRNQGCHLLFIQCAVCAKKFDGCCCGDCQKIALMPDEVQKKIRTGLSQDKKVFAKGRVSGKIIAVVQNAI